MEDFKKIVVEKYIQTQNSFIEAEEKLEKYFRNKIKNKLQSAKTKEDFVEIKEYLRIMPLCASKTLIFRSIILRENEILNK